MIVDSFTFNAELDLLECRLTELDGLVDKFVLAEATVNQSYGQPKPLHYEENKKRFAPWADKIVHVVVDDMPVNGDAWMREAFQRDAISRGLKDAGPDDLLLFGDVDEIPSVPAVKQAAEAGFGLFSQRCLIFAADWELPYLWTGTCAARMSQVGSVAQLRNLKNSFPVIGNGGWHLTWLGGPEGIRAKLASHCHLEANAMITRRLDAGTLYERGIFWGGNGPEEDTQMAARDVDETWPKWIYQRKCPAIWFRPRVESHVE